MIHFKTLALKRLWKCKKVFSGLPVSLWVTSHLLVCPVGESMEFNAEVAASVLSHTCVAGEGKMRLFCWNHLKNILSLKLVLFNSSRVVGLWLLTVVRLVTGLKLKSSVKLWP